MKPLAKRFDSVLEPFKTLAIFLTAAALLVAMAAWVNATGAKADEAIERSSKIERRQDDIEQKINNLPSKDDLNNLGNRMQHLEDAVINHLAQDRRSR